MKKLFSFLFLFAPLLGIAQQKILDKNLDKNGVVTNMVFDNSKSFIPIEKASQLLRDTLKLLNEDELIQVKERKDELGFIRKVYVQRYKGLKVEDGLYGAFSKNGKIEYISGEYKNVRDVDIIPVISEKEALDFALSYIKANKYRWQISSEELDIKSYKKDSLATYYPKGELLICKDLLKTNSIFRLAYKFDIFAVNPLSHSIYYIDAITGDLLDKRNLIFDTNTDATGTSLYSGSVQITTDSYNGNNFRLFETRLTNNVVIHTFNANNLNWSNNNWHPIGFSEFNNTTTTWTSEASIDAHWGAERVIDYWNSRGWISLNGTGTPIPINGYVHYGSGIDNASWDGVEMLYGDGASIFKKLVSLDIVGHETGHGIMQYTSNFSGSSGQETQSLNEGFSDIWGAVIENSATPDANNNWLIGEKIMLNGKQCLRSLRSPKTEGYNTWTSTYPGGYPATYQKTFWIDPSGCSIPSQSNDYCYCHTNATILSHWFYLLSQGGIGTNEIPNSYTVWGLGINNAADIVWRAESNNLLTHPNAQYSDVMTATIQAATDLSNGNQNSIRVMQVRNAWYAVGLGTQPTQMSISGQAFLCSSGNSFTIINPVVGALTWQTSSNISYVSGTNPAIFKANGYVNGPGWIQAYYDGVPGPIKNVWVVNIYNIYIYSVSGYIGSNNTYHTFEVNPYNSGDSIHWEVYPYCSYFSNWQAEATIGFDNPGDYVILAQGFNSCGSSNMAVFNFHVYESYFLSPNPATTEVTITVNKEKSSNVIPDKVYDVSILDMYGSLKSQKTYSGESFQIPVSNLKNGNYFVKIRDGKTFVTKKLVIKH